MPTYEHLCNACNQEFEATYSIKASVPDTCPLCNEIGQITRLISLGGKGVVVLGKQEMKEHISSESKKIKQEISTNENMYANIRGEDRYHKEQTVRDRYKKMKF